MNEPVTLVCFAVKEEASAFQQAIADRPDVKILITGIGQANAERELQTVLNKITPTLVLSCGFAGGLDPDLPSGSVVFDSEGNLPLESSLTAAGARKVTFHCANRIASSSTEKRTLRTSTRADAVEMESHIISATCRQRSIPCATIRVILDTATQDLPLDFNKLMTSDMRLNYVKLAGTLATAPTKIPAMTRLGRQSKAAAQSLSRVLCDVLQK